MSFASPWFLLCLVVVPVAIWWYLGEQRHRARQAAAFAAAPVAPSALGAGPGWRRHVPIVFYGVALALLAVAIARPERTVAVPAEQATVVLVTDRSGSMEARDVAPDRLEAARRAVDRFLQRLPGEVRAALVAFNQRAEVLATPTTERGEIRDGLRSIQPSGGTATGDALAAALRLVRPRGASSAPAEAPPAAIVLLTDGVSVRGRDPVEVARQARRLRVPVYTVALGTPRGTIRVPRAGGGTQVRRVPPDPAGLRRIARASGGQAFEARDSERLDRVYEELGSRVGRKDEVREMTAGFAGAGFLLVLAGAAASLRLFGRLP